MATRFLGNSDLNITPIGFGAWAIGGGDYAFGWGEQDETDSIAAIRRALDLGLNWIDTAAVYGLGRSEEVVGRALEGVANRPYVFTKCERVWDADRAIGPCLKRDSIRRECEDSLRRLKVDLIDLYQIHWPQPDEDVEEGWTTMAELQSEGKVRWIGVSNFNVEQLKRAQAISPVTSLQPPYSLIQRSVETEILPFCLENNIGVLAYSPMGSGLLTGKMTRERIEALPENDWRSRAPNFKEPNLTANLRIAEKLSEIAARYGRSAGEAAIAWVLNNKAVTGAIVGIRHPDQLAGVIGALDFRLTETELIEVEDHIRR